MGIDGFHSLEMPLKLAEPAYLYHVSSVFLLSLRFCERNLILCIGPIQFLNSSLYWPSGTIQALSSLEQVNPFILASGSIPDQGNNEFSSSLYNPLHRGESMLSLDPYTLSDHLTTTMVDIHPYGAWLLVIAPSGAEFSICIDF